MGGGSVAGVIGAGRARLLVVAALITGLLGMHALVVGGCHSPGPPGTAGSSGMSVTASSGPAAGPAAPSARASMVGAHHLSAQGRAVGGAVDAARAASSPLGAPGPSGQPPLHLCLAVLAALLLLAVAALARVVPSGDPDAMARLRHARGGRRTQRARPPPTSVRLAQLCVLRN